MNNSFPLKHWLLTLMLGAVLLFVCFIILNRMSGNSGELLLFTILVFFYSVFFSLPALGIQYLLFYILNKNRRSSQTIKWMLFSASVAETGITLLVIGGVFLVFFVPVYAIASLVVCLVLKTPETVIPLNNENRNI